MAIGTLFGTNTESVGLYGTPIGGTIPSNVYQTYFEWFIFKESSGQPATPTGGSWDFSANVGTPPTGWTSTIATVPLNTLWMSIAFVDSRNPTVLLWSAPGLLSDSSVYATCYADTFTGDGTSVNWTLTTDPVTVLNLDVSINGVTQVPTTDYTVSGTTFTTTTAAPLGAVILVKYQQSLALSYYGAASNVQFTPVGTISATNVQSAIAEILTDFAASSGSSLVGYLPAGTGAVSTTVQAKLRESVSIFDKLTTAQIALIKSNVGTDVSAELALCLAEAMTVFCPAGTYLLSSSVLVNTFDGQTIVGDGIFATWFKKQFNGQAFTVTKPRSSLREFGVIGTGYTGDGIHVLANACYMENIYTASMGGSGFRIGSDTAGNNSNSWTMLNCSAIGNTLHGVYCHDADVNSNAGTSINFTALGNGGDGVRIGLSQVNTWVGTLAEGNTGWGCNVAPSVATQTVQTFLGGDYEGNITGQFQLTANAFLNYVQVNSAVAVTLVVDLGVENTIVVPGSVSAPRLYAYTTSTTGFPYTGAPTTTVQRISNAHPNVNNRNYAFQLLNAAYGDFGLYQSLASGGDAGAVNALPKLLWESITGPGLRFSVGAPNNANGIDGDIYFNRDGGALTTIYHKRAGAWVGIV